MSFSLRPSTPPASLVMSKYAFAPFTVSLPRKCADPYRAEQEPMRISLSVTPVVDCAGVGVETVKRQLKSALSPKIYFRVFFFISLSDLKHVQRGRSFDSSCLVLRSRDVNAFGRRCAVLLTPTHERLGVAAQPGLQTH